MTRPYRGRFAPSPTGPLHAGSLVAAIASFLDARAHGGQWYLRIDDADRPRSVPGVSERIIAELQRLGLLFDGDVRFQAARTAVYDESVAQLRRSGHCFDCGCTRREVGRGPYAGTCRRGLQPGRQARAVRIEVGSEVIHVADRFCAGADFNLTEMTGDFIVRRADQLPAYHLATVVDDARDRISDVVRGADLMPSSAPQIWLYRCLGLPPPRYGHVPVVCDKLGHKLSKQHNAPSTETQPPALLWYESLTFLGFAPPRWSLDTPVNKPISWALERWLGHVEALLS
jgi:glutamyl-Q tRNA(Asp) synthetase